MKDYLEHNDRVAASTSTFEKGTASLMTDQGFKKFRRRGKQSNLFPARDTGSDSRADQPEVRAPEARPTRPVRKVMVQEQPAPQTPRPADVAEPQPSRTLYEEAGLWHPEREMLPAHLPDPWHLMRRVEISGLGSGRSRLPLVDFFRSTPTARAFDLLRTRMLHTLREHGWKRVAICAPTSGAGTSFTAANLALSMARVPGSRTLLMDMNLRNPGLARTLGLQRSALYSGDMQGFLRGEVALEEHLVAASANLALGLNASASYNSAEVLHEPQTDDILEDMMRRTRADVALFDLPAVLESDDVAAFLPKVDGVLLISDGSQTTARHLKACEKLLAGQTELLGVVLNRARKSDMFAAAN